MRSGFLFFILGVIIYFSVSYMWNKDDFHSFNQIINYNLDNIRPDENYAVINSLKDKRFVVDKDLGNTTRVSYVFHDKDGNESFTITDVGNRDLYVVTIDGLSKTYLMHDDTKLRKALGQWKISLVIIYQKVCT